MPKTEQFCGSIQKLADTIDTHPDVVTLEIVEEPMSEVEFQSVGYPPGTRTNAGLIDFDKMLRLTRVLEKSNIGTLIFNNNEFSEKALTELCTFLQTDTCQIKNILFTVDSHSLRGKIPQILDAVKKSGITNLKLLSTNLPSYRYQLSLQDEAALDDLLQHCKNSLKTVTLENVHYKSTFKDKMTKLYNECSMRLPELALGGSQEPSFVQNHDQSKQNHAPRKNEQKEGLISLLDSYLIMREAVTDAYGAKKEYYYGSFFSLFQKSLTQKRNAVNALKSALEGNDVDLSEHLSTLRNGALGQKLRDFIKSGKTDTIVNKEVNTVRDFIQALQLIQKENTSTMKN